MQVDLSRNYLVWTNTESVYLESAVPLPGGGQKCTINRVLRIELSAREKAESKGAYIGAELSWLLPVPEMPVGFVPKPGDILTDYELDNIAWTIQDVAGQCRDRNGFQVYRVRTLALSIAYQLRDLIDVQTPSNLGQQDSAAAKAVKVWRVKYPQVPCRMQPESSETVDQRAIRGMVQRYTCYTAAKITVTNEDRIAFKGLFFDIVSARNMEQLDNLLAIACEHRPA